MTVLFHCKDQLKLSKKIEKYRKKLFYKRLIKTETIRIRIKI